MTYGCIRFIDSYRFVSSSLDNSVKTLVDDSHKTLNDLDGKIVDNDEILITVKEIKSLIKEDTYKNDSIKDLMEDYPDKIKNLEDASLNYMRENDPKLLKTRSPDEWNYLTKK